MTLSPPTLSLREIAAQEWERQQAEVAARKIQEIERARENLMSDAWNGLYKAFGPPSNDPFRKIDWARKTCEVKLGSTDDLLASRPDCCVVVITFMGERFEWKRTGGARNEFGIVHIYDCPDCDVYGESPSLGSLADLGNWLAVATARCNHDDEASS